MCHLYLLLLLAAERAWTMLVKRRFQKLVLVLASRACGCGSWLLMFIVYLLICRCKRFVHLWKKLMKSLQAGCWELQAAESVNNIPAD
jgi:hypothetical protein